MSEENRVSRRNALLGGGTAVALAASLAMRGVAAAQQKGIQSGGGIAGGGVIEVSDGAEATFSVFGSRFVVDGEPDPIFFGNLTWVDSRAVTLASTEISAYGPVEGEENAREMTGFLTMNGEGNHPFTLKMVDGGGPGEGKDTMTLTVQASGEAAATPATGAVAYTADATLTNGDLQLLSFEFPE
jgi:hypothetical protein